MNVAGALGARCERPALLVDDDQLGEIRGRVFDQAKVVVEPIAGSTLTVRPSSKHDVVVYLVGGREDPDIEEALLEPEIELACGLRAHTL